MCDPRNPRSPCCWDFSQSQKLAQAGHHDEVGVAPHDAKVSMDASAAVAVHQPHQEPLPESNDIDLESIFDLVPRDKTVALWRMALKAFDVTDAKGILLIQPCHPGVGLAAFYNKAGTVVLVCAKCRRLVTSVEVPR